MRNYFSFFLLMLCCIFFTNCKKSDSGTTTPVASDYSPLTTGTNWTYKFTNATATDTFVQTVTGKDTMANNKSYSVLSSSDGTPNTYMTKIGTDYFRFLSFPSVGISNVQELYLKDNLDVNGTWNDTASFVYSGFSLTATLVHTIKEKGASKIVNGVTYNNVIHVRLDVSVTLIGAIQGGDFYYAKDIGLIESDVAISGTGVPTYAATETILSFQKK